MIELALFFAFGFLLACFGLAFFDKAVVKRTLQINARDKKTASPLSQNEIKARREQRHADFGAFTRKLETSLGEFKKKMSEQIDEIDKKSEQIRGLLVEVEAKSDALQQAEKREQLLKQNVSKLDSELSTLKGNLHDLEKKQTAALSALSEREKTIADLKSFSDLRNSEIEAVKLKVTHLEADIASRQEALSKAEQSLAQERAANASTAAKFEAQEHVLKEKTQQIGQLQSRVSDLTAQLRGQISETERAIFKAQSLLEDRHKVDEDLARRASDAELRLRNTLGDMEKVRAEHAILEGQLSAAREERNRLTQDVKVLQGTQKGDATGAKVPGTLWP